MAEESVSHKTARTSFWAAIEKISTMGVEFIVSMVLARLLSPSDYGSIAMLGIFISVANQFVSCGFGSALIRKLDCTQSDYSTAFFFNVGVAIITYIILFFSAPFIATFYNIEILCPILRVSGICLIVNSTKIVQYSILTKNLAFKSLAKVTALTTTISGAIGIYFAYNGFGAWALVIQSLSTSLLTAISTILITRWIPTLTFSKESFRYLWNYGSKMLASGLISTIYMNLYSLLIGKVYDSKALGIFNRGQNTANIYPNVVQSVFIRNSLPIMAQYQNDRERLIHIYREFCKLAGFVTFPIVFMVIVLAQPFVYTILTEKWSDAIIYIQIFSVFSLLAPINVINYNLLLVIGRTDATLKAEIIKKVSGIILIFSLLRFGPLVLAVGSTCFNIAVYFVNLCFAKKYVGISIKSQIKDLTPPLLAAVVCSVFVHFTLLFIANDWFKLMVGGILQATMYFFVTKFILKMSVYSNIMNLIKNN